MTEQIQNVVPFPTPESMIFAYNPENKMLYQIDGEEDAWWFVAQEKYAGYIVFKAYLVTADINS